ncbi:g-type lectin s-receptor-like serine/threonine-protein kinase [Quercus suber]|uniref:G-type lectin s-receptor-like serine/threonine-protein kinase n=1 Tax=Quercus suber TaxID=58331 RepID=A0AAW0IS86_QUESU
MVGKYQAVEFVLVSTKDTMLPPATVGICQIFQLGVQEKPVCSVGIKVLLNSWNLSDFSAGCARKTSLQCGNDSLANGKRDKFWEMPNMKLPDHSQTVAVGSSSECESTCLNNCSCTAYAYGDHCSIWIGELLNLQQLTSADTNGGTLYLKLAASELPSSRNNKAIIIGVVLGSVAGIAILKLYSHALQQQKILKQTLDGTLSDAQSVTKKLNLKMIFAVTIAKATLIFQFQAIVFMDGEVGTTLWFLRYGFNLGWRHLADYLSLWNTIFTTYM